MINELNKLEEAFNEIMDKTGPTLLREFYKIKRSNKKGFISEPNQYDMYIFTENDIIYELTNRIPQQEMVLYIRKPMQPPTRFVFTYIFGMFTQPYSKHQMYINYYHELKTFLHEFHKRLPQP